MPIDLKRILIVSDRYYPTVGGVEKVVQQLAEGISKNNLDVLVLTRLQDNNSNKIENINGVFMCRIQTGFYNWYNTVSHKFKNRISANKKNIFFYWWKSIFILFFLFFTPLKKLTILGSVYFISCFFSIAKKFQIVHLHRTNFFLSIFIFLSKILKKKTIVTFHSYVPSEFQLFNHRHPLNWLINNFLHEKVHFIAVSQYLMHVLINDLHFPKERVHVIPNSVSLPSNLSIEKARAKIDKTVIFVGRLYEPEKDVSTLLRSWQIVLKKIPDAKLLLVGDGPDCEKLKLLAFDLKIEHATTFIGEVDNVTDFIQSAAIFCLPSKFEGLSIALLECMSWAIPCVVSAIPGNQELIQHGENGLVFALGKHEELAEQLLLFLSESQFAFECGRKARLTIEKKYSTQLFIQKHIELYKNIINN